MCQRRQLLLTACLLVWMAAECAHAQGIVGEAMLMQVLNNAGNLLNGEGGPAGQRLPPIQSRLQAYRRLQQPTCACSRQHTADAGAAV